VVVILIVTSAGRVVIEENVQLASVGRPEQANVIGVGIAAFAETVSATVPVWPPTMLTEEGAADKVSAV
jgi:hypothetical protein